MFKLYLNMWGFFGFFSWFICPKRHFFLTVMHSVQKFMKENKFEFPENSGHFYKKWVSKVRPRLAKRKNSMEIGIYSIFGELVHAQKQFAELPGHFVVKGEVIFYIFFLVTIQSHSPPSPLSKKNFQTRQYLMILQHVMCAYQYSWSGKLCTKG